MPAVIILPAAPINGTALNAVDAADTDRDNSFLVAETPTFVAVVSRHAFVDEATEVKPEYTDPAAVNTAWRYACTQKHKRTSHLRDTAGLQSFTFAHSPEDSSGSQPTADVTQ